MFEQTRQEKGLIQNETCLSPTYTPDQPVGREKEIEEIANALRPIARRKDPETVFVHGPAGVGKTTCIKHVLDELESQTRTETVYINCWQYNTRSSLITELLIRLGYPAPRKGKPVDQLVSKLRELIDRHTAVIVALGEFDQLTDATEIVYDLYRINDQIDTPLGIVLGSNKHPKDVSLDQRSSSRLTFRSIYFAPYDVEELVPILHQRAEEALGTNTIADDALYHIAERVSEQGGDCRHAVELLSRAARIAEREQNSEVTTVHVEQSFNPARG